MKNSCQLANTSVSVDAAMIGVDSPPSVAFPLIEDVDVDVVVDLSLLEHTHTHTQTTSENGRVHARRSKTLSLVKKKQKRLSGQTSVFEAHVIHI